MIADEFQDWCFQSVAFGQKWFPSGCSTHLEFKWSFNTGPFTIKEHTVIIVRVQTMNVLQSNTRVLTDLTADGQVSPQFRTLLVSYLDKSLKQLKTVSPSHTLTVLTR